LHHFCLSVLLLVAKKMIILIPLEAVKILLTVLAVKTSVRLLKLDLVDLYFLVSRMDLGQYLLVNPLVLDHMGLEQSYFVNLLVVELLKFDLRGLNFLLDRMDF
jgi:hypothetical protein